MNLDAQIEAILFYMSEPQTASRLAEILHTTPADISEGFERISERYRGTGLALVRHNDTATITTAVEASALIEQVAKEDLARDIGKAGIETLSVVLYRSPVTRGEIDYIRGVNSTFILRALMARGLVERLSHEGGGVVSRTPRYVPTLQLLRYLGVTRVEDLPDYQNIKIELTALEKEKMPDLQPAEDQLSEDGASGGSAEA